MRDTQSTDVVVVGAGPYGLAAAAHLKAAGVETRVFGDPMGAWRHNMPKGMFLKSAFEATSISAPGGGYSLGDHCRETGDEPLDEWHPIPIDMFVDYGLRFQERYVKDIEHKTVTGVTTTVDGFRVELADGEAFSARRVVVASGHVQFATMPPALGALAADPELVSHQAGYAGFDRFAGRRVAVVGAGQSALESAVLLREAGADVHLIARRPALSWGGPPIPSDKGLRRITKPATPFGPGWSHFFFTRAPQLFAMLPDAARTALAFRTYGPSGGWWLRGRFEGRIEVRTATIIEEAQSRGGKVLLGLRSRSGEATSLEVDHVLAATGYTVDVDAIDYLDPRMRAQVARVRGCGSPALSRSFQSSVPGLHFIGLSAAATFGPLQRFVHGTHFAGETLGRALSPVVGARAGRPREAVA